MLKAKKNSMNIDVTGVDDMTDRCDLMREVIRRNCDVDPRIIDSLVIKLRRYGDENHMLIRSSFLRRIISQIINKMLKKQLPGTEVQLGEVQANWSEKEQKLKIHLVVDAEMTKPQLMDILKKADVI